MIIAGIVVSLMVVGAYYLGFEAGVQAADDWKKIGK